jgi:hypothetical protein
MLLLLLCVDLQRCFRRRSALLNVGRQLYMGFVVCNLLIFVGWRPG